MIIRTNLISSLPQLLILSENQLTEKAPVVVSAVPQARLPSISSPRDVKLNSVNNYSLRGGNTTHCRRYKEGQPKRQPRREGSGGLAIAKVGFSERRRVTFTRTRSDGFKVNKRRSSLDRRKKFFSMRVVRHWDRLAGPSQEVFKVRLDGALSHLI